MWGGGQGLSAERPKEARAGRVGRAPGAAGAGEGAGAHPRASEKCALRSVPWGTRGCSTYRAA